MEEQSNVSAHARGRFKVGPPVHNFDNEIWDTKKLFTYLRNSLGLSHWLFLGPLHYITFTGTVRYLYCVTLGMVVVPYNTNTSKHPPPHTQPCSS